MKILALESSCDETAAAVVEHDTTIPDSGVRVISSAVATSSEFHAQFGGVLPELAARKQLEFIIPVLSEALKPLQPSDHSNAKPFEIIKKHIDAVAVTVGPGLIGSLLIGVEAAKAICFVTKKPLIPVNHVHAHMYANVVDYQQPTTNSQRSIVDYQQPTSDDQQSTVNKQQQKQQSTLLEKKPQKNSQLSSLISLPHEVPLTVTNWGHLSSLISQTPISFPAISLVVSGGHTELFLMNSIRSITWLGGTIDDAAGEALDKTARLLGFENRGGVAIEEAAKNFQQQAANRQQSTILSLPRPLLHDETLNFSFSGLKTAVVREWKKHIVNNQQPTTNNQLLTLFAFEIQEAVTDVLVAKTVKAAMLHNAQSILLSGGVAANQRLRQKCTTQLSALNSHLSFYVPPKHLCTDNAVSIGACAFFRGKQTDWRTIIAQPNLSVEV